MKARLKSRWGYGISACLAAVASAPIWCLVIAATSGMPLNEIIKLDLYEVSQAILVLIVTSAVSAILCWPTWTERSKTRMALAGGATVALTFILIGASIPVMEGSGRLTEVLMMSGLVTLWTSLFTFGLPYWFGAILSTLLADTTF